MNINSEISFDPQSRVAPLGIIAMEGASELGEKINDYLVKWSKESGRGENGFLIETQCPRFSSGDGKGLIKSTVRGADLFIIVDVGNYNCKYKMFGEENAMSPDDHYQDIKRIIAAIGGRAFSADTRWRRGCAPLRFPRQAPAPARARTESRRPARSP